MKNISPITGRPLPRWPSPRRDVELALDAAHAAKDAWGGSLAERAAVLNAIADVIEANLTMLAVAETWTTASRAGDAGGGHPLAVDHFRYFAGATRSLEAVPPRSTRTPSPTTSTSLWVVGQIIRSTSAPHGAWKIAPAWLPATARGQAGVAHPWSILKLAE